MAKVIIAGDALVVTSTVKMEDLKRVQKYAPDALVIRNEEKEPVFGVVAGDVPGINACGIEFDAETRDENKFACLTLPLPRSATDALEYAIDKVGPAIAHLKKIEAGIPAALETIQAEREAVAEAIEVLA